MTKSELIERVAGNAGVTKVVAARVVDSLLQTVTTSLQQNEKVDLPGFGSFLTGNRAARTGRNPQTGQVIQIKASRVAKFKAGKKLKEAVQ